MSRGISTRRARALREKVLYLKAWRQEILDHRLARQISDAKQRIESINEQLTPAYRLKLHRASRNGKPTSTHLKMTACMRSPKAPNDV